MSLDDYRYSANTNPRSFAECSFDRHRSAHRRIRRGRTVREGKHGLNRPETRGSPTAFEETQVDAHSNDGGCSMTRYVTNSQFKGMEPSRLPFTITWYEAG